MRERTRNGIAITIAAVCFVLGVYSWLIQRPPFSGVTLRYEGTTLVVAGIDPAVGISDATFRVGSVVTEVNGLKVEGLRPELVDQALRGDFSELGGADPTYGTKRL